MTSRVIRLLDASGACAPHVMPCCDGQTLPEPGSLTMGRWMVVPCHVVAYSDVTCRNTGPRSPASSHGASRV